MPSYSFNESKFQYLLSRKPDYKFNKRVNLYHDLILNYTDKTDIIRSSDNQKLITIIGICIDSYGELKRNEIADFICISSNTYADLPEIIGRFAGKYVIIYQDTYHTCLFGDASSSLPIYYHTISECYSSSEYLISNFLELETYDIASKILKTSQPGIGLPFNITRFRNLEFLLPNHYVLSDSINFQVYRYRVNYNKSKTRNLDEILKNSLAMVLNIAAEYQTYYNLVCPLTAGWDSRVILSILQKNKNLESYTFNHSHLGSSNPEVLIPSKICQDLNIKHRKLEVATPVGTELQSIIDILGEEHDEKKRNMAYTLRETFGENAIIEGSIIGHIAKSGVFRDVPDLLNYDNYFITKTHSYSKEAKQYTTNYLTELRKQVHNSELYDLFALEIRCGRWANQSSELYSLLGVNVLNIFNCSELIAYWMDIDRSLRTKSIIHKHYIANTLPSLLNYPINPQDKFKKIKEYSFTYFLSSFAKYYLDKYRLYFKSRESNP